MSEIYNKQIIFYFLRHLIIGISDEIENGNYEELEKCTNIATITSILKGFLRQMPEPLLTRHCQQLIEQAQIDFLGNANERLMIAQLEGIFMRIDPLSYSVLKYFLLHLKDISETKGNSHKKEVFKKIY